jgi:hypothetical protein
MLGSGVMVVLSSAKAVRELMEKRSATTVDRPHSHFVQEATGGLQFGLARFCESSIESISYC